MKNNFSYETSYFSVWAKVKNYEKAEAFLKYLERDSVLITRAYFSTIVLSAWSKSGKL